MEFITGIAERCHPPTQETTALAVEECVTPDGDFPGYPDLASADFAVGRMTRRSLGDYEPNHFRAHWRSRVWLLGTTGLPVGLHKSRRSESRGRNGSLPEPIEDPC